MLTRANDTCRARGASWSLMAISSARLVAARQTEALFPWSNRFSLRAAVLVGERGHPGHHRAHLVAIDADTDSAPGPRLALGSVFCAASRPSLRRCRRRRLAVLVGRASRLLCRSPSGPRSRPTPRRPDSPSAPCRPRRRPFCGLRSGPCDQCSSDLSPRGPRLSALCALWSVVVAAVGSCVGCFGPVLRPWAHLCQPRLSQATVAGTGQPGSRVCCPRAGRGCAARWIYI